MKGLLKSIIDKNTRPELLAWIENVLEKVSTPAEFYKLFALIPRKMGKELVQLEPGQAAAMELLPEGFSGYGCTIDRLCRVYLLQILPAFDKDQYQKTIENLFLAADMNELVAIYSSLPLLAHPDLWTKRCAEGIRSNIGPVLEAIMYHNSYPSRNLDQQAWNQMVLKAFFAEKQIDLILGLDARNNEELAAVLVDYAHERWAAGRGVNAQLWRLVGPFARQRYMDDFVRVYSTEPEGSKDLLTRGIMASGFLPARELAVSYGFSLTY